MGFAEAQAIEKHLAADMLAGVCWQWDLCYQHLRGAVSATFLDSQRNVTAERLDAAMRGGIADAVRCLLRLRIRAVAPIVI